MATTMLDMAAVARQAVAQGDHNTAMEQLGLLANRSADLGHQLRMGATPGWKGAPPRCPRA
jgi:hypothetical protein